MINISGEPSSIYSANWKDPTSPQLQFAIAIEVANAAFGLVIIHKAVHEGKTGL
jgi:hypothetical protein